MSLKNACKFEKHTYKISSISLRGQELKCSTIWTDIANVTITMEEEHSLEIGFIDGFLYLACPVLINDLRAISPQMLKTLSLEYVAKLCI